MLGIAGRDGDDQLVAGERLRRAGEVPASSIFAVSAVASTSAGAPCRSCVTRSLLPAKLKVTVTPGWAAVKSSPSCAKASVSDDAAKTLISRGSPPELAGEPAAVPQAAATRASSASAATAASGRTGSPRPAARRGRHGGARLARGGAAEGPSSAPRHAARHRRPDHHGSGWSCPWLLSKHGEVLAFPPGPTAATTHRRPTVCPWYGPAPVADAVGRRAWRWTSRGYHRRPRARQRPVARHASARPAPPSRRPAGAAGPHRGPFSHPAASAMVTPLVRPKGGTRWRC